MDKFIERLNSLINEISGGNVTDFAKKSGIKQATLFNYTKGRMPNAESLYNICNNLGVSIDWLLAGRGEPYLSSTAYKENPGEKEAQVSQESSSNNFEISDTEIIQGFSDKRYARELNSSLVELEQLNQEAFKKVGPYIKGLLEGLRTPRPCCQYAGPDRRVAQRRVKDNTKKYKGEKDRRSGKDRRVAAQR